MTRPYVVGLTGNIATGKSTVTGYLAAKGAHTIDADKLAHAAMAPGTPAYGQIVEHFGRQILDESGAIARSALGRIVFQDPGALARLESILHPQVLALARAEIQATAAPVVILEAIKLLDGGQTITLCDEVWVVTSPVDQQLARLARERHMDGDEARRRMAAQSSQAEKVARADVVIENGGTLAQLQAQLDLLWEALLRRAAEKGPASGGGPAQGKPAVHRDGG